MVKISFSYPPGVRRWPPKPSCAPIAAEVGLIVTALPHLISSLRQAASRLANKRYLARTSMRRGSISYSIGLIEHGRVTAIGIPAIGDGDVRRLMYGLDLL